MASHGWLPLRAGDYVHTTWQGDAQLTYRAVKQKPGWVLSRQVAGAGLLILAPPFATLHEAQQAAESDAVQPL